MRKIVSLDDNRRNSGEPINTQTNMFRDDIGFVLREDILPYASRPLRVLVAGCSTGEEAFSTLMWAWPVRDNLILEACDFNLECLHAAESTHSTKFYGHHLGWDRAQHLVKQHPDIGQLAESAEELEILGRMKHVPVLTLTYTDEFLSRIRFFKWDVSGRPLPAPYDIIAIKNVLCHYNETGRAQIVGNQFESLVPGGKLFLDADYMRRSWMAEYMTWLKTEVEKAGFHRDPSRLDPRCNRFVRPQISVNDI